LKGAQFLLSISNISYTWKRADNRKRVKQA